MAAVQVLHYLFIVLETDYSVARELVNCGVLDPRHADTTFAVYEDERFQEADN